MNDTDRILRALGRDQPVEITALPELSHFVARALDREAGTGAAADRLGCLRAQAESAWTAERMRSELARELSADATAEQLAAALRRLRRRVLLGLIARDVTGVAALAEVMQTTTALAELALNAALSLHARDLARVHGVPCSADGVPQDLLIVGMGKLGGVELNVSSDIDLVFVFDEDGTTRAVGEYAEASRPLSNPEFFERLGRRVIAALAEVTAEGFVFRVDMRLRPNGDSGPLVVSNEMLEEYLVALGREWERFAWLKGRVVSMPVFASGEQFARQRAALEDIVRPFVFRKYLDYGAIASLRELHARIRAETGRRSAGRDDAGDNVKLGRGGIREIEFLAQTFQIIRGGREPRLRSRSTLATLSCLAELGSLPQDTAARLASCYEFLRDLEHALQYVDDAQTHLLPADAAARARVAALMGTPGTAALMERYLAVREFVASAFDAVFVEPATQPATLPLASGPGDAAGSDAALLEHLELTGYRDPAATAQRLRGLLASRRVQMVQAAARTRIEQLLASGLRAAVERARGTGASHDIGPDELFARFGQLIDVIAGRSTYVSLLHQFPTALDRVMRLLAASRWATDYLVRHPILLDELLDERVELFDNEHTPDWLTWAEGVRARLFEADGDQEVQMNVLRDAHHAQVFRLLVADLDGRLTVERLADHLSALADATLALTLECAWQSVAKRHRAVPSFAVIAYGKLGGKELGYASDLDLIFLYEDEHSDAAEVYSTLARRLMLWLTTQTSSGILFDIDLRLRPNGNAGLMVSSFDAFSRYQRNEDGLGAWVWETQALTRARFSCGDAGLGRRFEEERASILACPRDLPKLREEVLAMRVRMLDGHPNPSALFDLKHDRGGMVDIEFIVQYLVLAHAHEQPELIRNLGNIALLKMAGAMGFIDAGLARLVSDAYRSFRQIQHRLRLNGAERARVDPGEVRCEADAVRRLWGAVFEVVP
ncbi:MAG TPA: bifunctional [glutamate--ammonia ligase]-adenylyl-L-tyrosine phosphorylase/[glutamate--ammonia-ligase] adenylyltransferase [Burkholderiaceae bacterium]|nr:bifunctional [glutamate--ammonia ligase]-adenylyl-L-tyrosine phosphorylase/[glutamate--ammonia-ligase] adenylyltransferase [Burkholderiaceae bacterium]